jgi:nitroimidazol reductase NimA-like FMN-containing flavoprotein (pyridoxamine 5'-phosphate oxidase superfamily)
MYGVLKLPLIKLPKMKQQRIEELLKKQFLCRIAFRGDQYPYLAPFQYAYIDGVLYFHFTRYGKKMSLVEQDNHVAVEIETYEPDLHQYCFVVLRGELEVVSDPDERKKAITQMVDIGSSRLSSNFLAAHGMNKSDGWHALSADKPLVIMKLTRIAETIALESP